MSHRVILELLLSYLIKFLIHFYFYFYKMRFCIALIYLKLFQLFFPVFKVFKLFFQVSFSCVVCMCVNVGGSSDPSEQSNYCSCCSGLRIG